MELGLLFSDKENYLRYEAACYTGSFFKGVKILWYRV
jgi:hypothetical protein